MSDPRLEGSKETRKFERDLPGALRAVTERFPTHAPDVINGAVTRGKRLRRVRRAKFSAAACALALAVVGGGVALDREVGRDAAPASDHTGLDARPGAGVTGEQMVTALKGLLPKGAKVTGAAGTGTRLSPKDPPVLTADPAVKARFTTADGVATGVSVMVTRPDPDTVEGRQTSCPQGWFEACERVPQSDGSTAVIIRDARRWDDTKVQTTWTVLLDRRDGARVEVVAFGGGDEEEATSPIDPKLSFDQLVEIAASRKWDTAAGTVLPPEKRVLGILTKLVPPGYEISERSAFHNATWQGQLQLTDPGGRATLAANLDTSGKQADFCPADANRDCRSETLPDGSRLVITRQQIGNAPAGVLSWDVQLSRPDGLTILVSEHNNGNGSRGPDRAEPPLTIEQLQAIATSPLWTS